MATLHVTEETFEETVSKPGIVLLDFWAAWCGPCRVFAPVFERASETHADIAFGKIDTDAERGLAAALEISSIPTIMALRDGILIFRQAGALPPAALEQLIAKIRELDMDEVRKQIAEHEKAHGEAPDEPA